MRKESMIISHFHTSEKCRTNNEKGKWGSCGQHWTFVLLRGGGKAGEEDGKGQEDGLRVKLYPSLDVAVQSSK